MFSLNQKVKLASVNARAEIHGEDRVPAFDLKIDATMDNDTLIDFHPELRGMLFKRDDSPDLVDGLDPEALTIPRFPKLGQLKWDWEGAGYTVRVDYGMGGDSDILLNDCKVDKFKFTTQHGGSIQISFRIVAHPESDDVGKLCEFIQRDIELTVTPPEPTMVQELFGDAP